MRPVPLLGAETPEENEAQTIKDVRDILVPAAGVTAALGPFRLPHVKSHGCVDATFTVNDGLGDLAVGLFSKPGSYDARIRFSNSSSKRQDDSDGDARGMAIKVFVSNNPPVEQDFLLSTEKVFFARSGKDFLSFVLALTRFDGRKVLETTNPDMHNLIKASQEALRPPNPLAMEYFSQVPYQFGPGRAVKYSAMPSSEPPVLDLTPTLADALKKHLSMRDATFDFNVQLQTDPVKMPIEDATVPWPEDKANGGSPYRPVATITVKKDTPILNCEAMKFDPWHHLSDHRPLGIINRIRGEIYHQAAAKRVGPKTQGQLTALMTIKEPVPAMVKELRKTIQEHALANGVRLERLGFVHSARFLILGDKFAIITSYDFDFRDYINTFVDELGPLFDLVLRVIQDAPPTPIQKYREEFVAYIERISVQPVLFYAAYPELSVQNILTMREKQK